MRDNTTIIDELHKMVFEILDKQIMAGLRKLRDSALEYAQTSHEFKNRTFNLEDSYAAGIYHNGVLIEKTLSDKKATEPVVRDGVVYSGHDRADKFVSNFKAGDGYTLVVVAAQFYAMWVEAIHGLDVLTGAYQYTKDEMKNIWKKLPETYYSER